jgi:CubicO group peptidase (beta-lactamase class C family)
MQTDRRALMGLGLLALGAGLAAPARAAPAIQVHGDPKSVYGGALDDIAAYAARHVSVHGLPGMTLSLTARDGFTATLQFGQADVERGVAVGPDHLFQIGSISKSFTAVCIFQLVEAGKLSLDADVRGLLPGAPLPSDGPTTVRSLLNHSSGLPDDAPIFPRGGNQALWRGFAPGKRWSYSNLGFMLLSTIVEALERKPFAEVLQARVLSPLGMTSTRGAILTVDRRLYANGYAPFYADRGYPRAGPLGPAAWVDMTEGSGCVASTAGDMALFARWLAEAGQGRGAPLLSDAAAAKFCKPTIPAPGWAVKDARYANGLAVVPVGGRDLLHHTGGMLAFSSAIHVDPMAGVGAFASTNVGLVPYRPRDLTAYACERLRAVVEAGTAPVAPALPPKPPKLADYAGRYTAPRGETLEVQASGDELQVVRFGRVIRMTASEADAFIAVDPAQADHVLVFRRKGEAVTRAWWGETEFVKPGEAFSPATPVALQALTGHYENDDPWRGGFRVTAQGRGLFLEGTTPLVARPDGSWRVGAETWSPERLRFDAVIGGRPRRANMSGVDYVRRPA